MSTVGKAILIRHVLHVVPTHLLATMNPPKGVLTHRKDPYYFFLERGK